MAEAVDHMEGAESPEAIEIQVGTGTDQKTFTIDSDILIHRSTYFREKLSRDSDGSQQGRNWVFVFHDYETETVELYLQCARRQPISVVPNPIPINYEGAKERVKLAEVYLFALRVKDSRTMNKMTKALLRSIWKSRYVDGAYNTGVDPNSDLVDIIWRGTAKESLMRLMILHCFAHAMSYNVDPWEDYPVEFLAELVQMLWTRNYSENRETVLWHGDGADKYLEEVSGDESEDEDEDGDGDDGRTEFGGDTEFEEDTEFQGDTEFEETEVEVNGNTEGDEDGDEDSDEHQAIRRPSRLYH